MSSRSLPAETWIVGGTLVTQDSERRVIKANIRIVDGRIAEITRSAPKKAGKGIQVIQAHDQFILPGFVQAHVHLCQTLFRNQADDLELLDWLSKKIWKMEAAHTARTLKTSALLGIHELLSTGTTCILDMGTVRHTNAIFEAVRDGGIRASVGKCLMDHPRTTPPTLRDATQAALKEAAELYEKWHGRENDRIRVSFAPRFVISCTEELLVEVKKLARSRNAIIHTHASENSKEIELVKELVGQENIHYLHKLGLTSPQLVLAHCVWLKPGELEILRETGSHVVHCPSSNMKLASGFARVPELRANGINVALGADGAPCNNNLNMLQEMRLAALIHKPANGPRSMRAQEVLDMATRDGAKAIGWFDDIGSIEVGKKADLIAFDLAQPENALPANATAALRGRSGPNSATQRDIADALASVLVYSTQAHHLRWTAVDGRMLYRNDGRSGEVLTIDQQKLVSRVRKAQLEIIRAISP